MKEIIIGKIQVIFGYEYIFGLFCVIQTSSELNSLWKILSYYKEGTSRLLVVYSAVFTWSRTILCNYNFMSVYGP